MSEQITPKPPANAETDAELAQQAAQWLVQLSDDAEDEQQITKEFEAWKSTSARHARIAEEMAQLIQNVQSIRQSADGDTRAAHAALQAAAQQKEGRRKRAKPYGPTLIIAMTLATGTWLALQTVPVGYLLADVRTSTGEWDSQTLADGTRISLNGRSAVNLHYDEKRRTLELVQGDILVDVAKDASRPFVVQTKHGSIRALGTRFIVSRQPDSTVLSMIESSVAVRTADELRQVDAATGNIAATQVNAGERVVITEHGISPVQAFDANLSESAWQQRQFIVEDQPLAAVLDELARHRTGHIHYSRVQIEDVRISAVLPLDDTDKALKLLSKSLPKLRIRTITPLLVMVDMQR